MKCCKKRIVSFVLAILLLCSLLTVGASAAGREEWVSAWSTSPVRASLSELGCLDSLGVTLAAVTSRVAVTPTASGRQLRLVFSNEYGASPLTISECTVGVTARDTRNVQLGSIRKVTFSGKTLTTIPAGKTITSDPVKMTVTAGEKLTVTTYFRSLNTQRTIGLIGGDTYAAVGNYTNLPLMTFGLPLKVTADSGAYEVIPALKEIDVLSSDHAGTCVVFGDSTVANEIPRLLAAKLRASGKRVSVTQAAIKGNRLLENGVGLASYVLGETAVKRFERDVLGQAGVRSVLVKIGINDIVHPYCESKAGRLTPVTAEQMIEGYKKLIDMAHKAHVKIYLGEIAPWKGYTRNILGMGDDVQWSEEIDAVRLEVNKWIRSRSCPADGYISCEALRDPNDEFALRPAYTTDGGHFTELGQKAFVDTVPLGFWR